MPVILRPEDLKIQSWPLYEKAKGMLAGVSNGIKVTHIPSGLSVTETRHARQIDNKSEALERLEQIIK
jgi:protein subunit release factor A